MSFRGEIAIVCDSCEGEHYFCADDFDGATLEDIMDALGWDYLRIGKDRQVLCDVCQEDIEEGRRCDRCWATLTHPEICGDCYGGTSADFYARAQGA